MRGLDMAICEGTQPDASQHGPCLKEQCERGGLLQVQGLLRVALEPEMQWEIPCRVPRGIGGHVCLFATPEGTNTGHSHRVR